MCTRPGQVRVYLLIGTTGTSTWYQYQVVVLRTINISIDYYCTFSSSLFSSFSSLHFFTFSSLLLFLHFCSSSSSSFFFFFFSLLLLSSSSTTENITLNCTCCTTTCTYSVHKSMCSTHITRNFVTSMCQKKNCNFRQHHLSSRTSFTQSLFHPHSQLLFPSLRTFSEPTPPQLTISMRNIMPTIEYASEVRVHSCSFGKPQTAYHGVTSFFFGDSTPLSP